MSSLLSCVLRAARQPPRLREALTCLLLVVCAGIGLLSADAAPVWAEDSAERPSLEDEAPPTWPTATGGDALPSRRGAGDPLRRLRIYTARLPLPSLAPPLDVRLRPSAAHPAPGSCLTRWVRLHERGSPRLS